MISFLLILLSTIIGVMIGYYSRKTFTPDDFKGKWYEWLTNQMSHILLGIFLTIPPMIVGYVFTGELPSRFTCFCSILGGYLAIELMQQGKISDIIEDTLFVVFYGSGMVLWCFKWTQHSNFEADIFYFIPWIFIMVTHLVVGSLRRINYGMVDIRKN